MATLKLTIAGDLAPIRAFAPIIEQDPDADRIFLVGILRRGVPISRKLKENIERFSDIRVELGEIDIALAAARKLGRTLEVRTARFPELLPMVCDGRADMAASGITITEGRLQTVDFSAPYATEGGMFLYRACDPMPTMSGAEHLRVATMDASTYDFHLSSHGVDPLRFDTFSAAMEAFRAGRVDTIFYDSCAVRVVAAESGGELAASRLETRENFGIAVGKGRSRLKAALDEEIAERGAR